MTDTEDVVQRFYAIWNERNLELIDELFLPNFRALPIAYEAAWEGEGPASMRHHLMSWLLGMPDLRMQEVRRISEGAWLASHWEMAGTHKGVLYGVAATGLSLRAMGTTWFEVRDGHIVQLRTSFDALGFLQQLGALPDTASLLANIANSSRP
jgi:predicted ester cyclase